MTILDYSENENISGLKGFHYRRIFDGYKRDGSPRYKYKIVLDGKYVKSPLKADADVFHANNRKMIIPDSVKNHVAVGDKKRFTFKTSAPGNQRSTKEYFKIWNGNEYVEEGDPTLVPNKAIPGNVVKEAIVNNDNGGVSDNSSSSINDTGNIYNDELKINWNFNVGEGIYDSINFGGPSEELKVSGNNSMPSTKWANTAEGDYYTYRGKMYKKGSVTARKADNIMAAKERAKQAARLRIENKGE